MSEMIERMSIAMATEKYGDYDARHYSKGYEAAAIAALKAMREPDDVMVSDGAGEVPPSDDPHALFGTEIAKAVWQAMIDAALGQTPA
jgi:hypothetical protein